MELVSAGPRGFAQAEDSKCAKRYESACFAAKQSVEKAFIAYWRNGVLKF